MVEGIVYANQVGFGYPSRPLFAGFDLEFRAGERVGLLGPNGAGKSTLIRLLLGLMQQQQGEILLFGKAPFSNPDIRASVGVVHQRPGFEAMYTGWDNLLIAGRFLGLSAKQVRQRFDTLASVFGALDFIRQPIMTLSGGQAKRLAIIRALLHKPKLLFLDEPTAALDVEGRQQFYRALAEVSQNEGTTIVWTSHYLQEIYEQCERVVMLISGKIVLDSPVSALASYSEVQSVKIQLAQGIQLAPEEESRLSIRSLNPSELMYQGTADELYSRVFPQLQREGIRVQRVTHDEASLEDIYLSLVERHRGSSL